MDLIHVWEELGKWSLEREVGESDQQSLSSPPEALVRADKSKLSGKSEKLSMPGCRVDCAEEVCGEFYGKATLGKLWVLSQALSNGTFRDHCGSEGPAAGRSLPRVAFP